MKLNEKITCCAQMLLRGAGQVMFQNNAWCGVLFIAGIFWGAVEAHQCVVAWGAMAGLAVSTLTGRLLGLPEEEGRQGLWGFNGILVGCAMPTFLGNSPAMWVALVLCAALSTWVRTGMNNVMRPWHVNSLTFPFVLCVWLFLLAARALHALPVDALPAPELPAADGLPAVVHHLSPADLLNGWLRGISQVFLINSPLAGVLFLAGLAVSSRPAALWAAAGSAAAVAAALAFGADTNDIAQGLCGYSPVLTAIALATVFYRPGWRSALWALSGVAVTMFVQAGTGILLAPVGLTSLTAPFCITTWLFLLPLIRLGRTAAKPDHTDWSEARKHHLKRNLPDKE